MAPVDKKQWPVTESGGVKGRDVQVEAEFMESRINNWKDQTGS